MKKLIITAVLLLSACVNVPTQQAHLLPSDGAEERYALRGLVRVSDMQDGVTKPYIEQGMSTKCPYGLTYESLNETINKQTPLFTWVEWNAVVICNS